MPVALAKSVTVSGSMMVLVKGTVKTMTWLKLKFAAGSGMAALLVAGVATMAISQTRGDDQLTPQEIAKRAQEAYAALSSYRDTGTVVAESTGGIITTTFNIRLQRPNLYRIDWTQTAGFYTNKGVVWSNGGGDFFMMGAAGQEQSAKVQKMDNMQQAFAAATGVSSSATQIPATFYKQNYGDVLGVPASGRSQTKREGDEKVGDVDCFVISSSLDPVKLPNNGGNTGKTTTRLWIGKKDYFIHQSQTMTEGASITLQESDSDLEAMLEKQNKAVTPEAIAALRAELGKSMNQAQGAKFVFSQKHENIVVNSEFSPSDFNR
jgi:outer membrane lipoprotein-sorting protein